MYASASFMVFNLFIDILRTNDIKSTITLVLVVFLFVKTEIIYFYEGFKTCCKLTLIGLRCSFILSRNESSTESKARISLIVIPRCTNPNYFHTTLMLAFHVFDCCGTALNFVWFTFVIVALNFSDFSTKRSLRKFLYRSLPSSTKAKMRFAAFSSSI